MNCRRYWGAGLAMLVVAFANAANAYELLDYRMIHTRDNPFRYYLDARANTPAGIALAEVEKATNAAFQTWEAVQCAYPDFEYMGRSNTNASINPNNVGDTYDTFNVSTVWVTQAADPYYQTALNYGNLPSATLALTYSGYLYQCDIFINAVNYKWTTLPNTTPNQGFIDLQTVLTHEVGHCLGFDDNANPLTSVMNPDFPVGGNRRTLDVDDSDGLCNLYPENGAVGSPCSATDPCSGGLTCVTRRKPDGSSAQYCTKGCIGNTNGECPNPFLCRPSTAVGGFARACLAVPDEFVTAVGNACQNPVECGSARGICQQPTALPSTGTAWVGGYCQQSCVAGTSPTVCPTGSVCAELGDNDRCLKSCDRLTGGCREGYTCSPLPEGYACVPKCYADSDCNPAGGTAFVCRVCDSVCIQNQQSGKAVGDPCDNTNPCGPGQSCLFFGTNPQGICSRSCSTDACDCPAGTSCRTVGSQNMCMRDCAGATCAQPLQCNPLGNVYSCQPPCRTDADCQSGFRCGAEGCYSTQPTDGGCSLCGDGGTPPPPPPPVDGGTGGDGGSPGGCGCSNAPTSALAFFAALALLMIGGRRSWPRR
ncbi:matrixin family metalloprotease [Stigmatella sp. ncwal1]|uniref:Matrixin family metalloprotease n=1 Tax=Stigmatella ashevillensis TaxID=2995309 RepID=A0ABT5DN10_9BACT|nr:matrixin family metalloprotease [Stigmatella ashevillena]MDC0715046.1 matrixin family metalloprotease [Stigmatella ashevillena]